MTVAGSRVRSTRRVLVWAASAASVVLASCTPPPPAPPPTTLPPATTTTAAPTTSTSTTTSTTTTTVPLGGTSFVYVADANLGAIKKIDTVTLATVDTISVGGTLGNSLALSGDRLYYTTSTDSRTGVGAYDLGTGVNDRAALPGTFYRPMLETSPALADRLFVAELGLSPGDISEWDMTGATASQVGTTPFNTIGSNIMDIAISADGTRIWVAAGSPYQITEVRTSDLQPSGKVYPTGPYPDAVATTTAGGAESIAAGRQSLTPGTYAFDAANPALATSYATASSLHRGVGFSPDGGKIYTATAGTPLKLATIDRSTGAITTAPLDATVDAQGLTMGQLAVDPGTGRVFVSMSDSIAVYNPDGSFGTMLTEAGPRGMVMTATGPTSTPPRLGATTDLGPPVIGTFTASRTSGPSPLSAAFSWTVSDPDGSALTCRLDFEANGSWDVTVPGCTSQSMRSATFSGAGTHLVTLQVTDAAGSTASASTALVVGAASTDAFGITLRFDGSLTAAQQAAFTTAATRWSQVIRGGLADVPVDLAANACDTGAPAFSGTIDDLMIDVDVAPIDGTSGVLAQAGPCLVRTTGGLPAYGVMQLDASDVADLEASGQLSAVVLHEMGHVLGFGTVWAAPMLSGAGTSSVNFTGPVALGAWRALSSAAGGVPVENSGGPGTADSHWRETVFGSELMTGYLDPGATPLSAVTIGSLADLGYTVDLGAADAFGLSGVRSATTSTPLHVATRLVHPIAAV